MADGVNARKGRAFVSYSREDTPIVTPLVKLLRTSHQDVFQDIDSIEPGRKWQGELDATIRESTTFLVFWCNHAESSSWVREECQLAMQGSHRAVVPVVLDETPLSIGLEHYQCIDLRALDLHEGRPFWTARKIAALLVFLVVLFSVAAILFSGGGYSSRPSPGPAPDPVPDPVPGPSQDSASSVVAIPVLISIIVLVLLAWVLRRWWRGREVQRRAADRIAEGVVAASPG